MDNLSYNIRSNKGFSGFLRSLFSGKAGLQKQAEEDNTKDYIEAVEAVKREMEYARRLFDNTSDSDLLESAIYQENAAKLRFSYLIRKAKEKNIRFTNYQSL